MQSQVFEKGVAQRLTQIGADHVYNAQFDSATYYADSLALLLPGHPVAPLMKAMANLWVSIPNISDSVFAVIERQLEAAIELAEEKDPELEDPEMIFFALAAHGMLAEYYADREYIFKAVGEAGRAYQLLKKGFGLAEEYPEFLFVTGLYNYFREKYPEKHPGYKPLMWLFKKGDKQKGLRQLATAVDQAILTRVEALVYLSYIYLRYEYAPKQSQEYLARLCRQYPNNFYAKAKYLESLANPTDFESAPIDFIEAMVHHPNDYYKLAGNVFWGYYYEVVIKDTEKAEEYYREGLARGLLIPAHGEYFKGLGYLGLGRILAARGDHEQAREALKQSLNYAETEELESAAEALLSQI